LAQKTWGFFTAQVEHKLPQAVVRKVWFFLGPSAFLCNASAQDWQKDMRHWLHLRVDCITPHDWHGICRFRNCLLNNMSGCEKSKPFTDGLVRRHSKSSRWRSKTFKYLWVKGCSMV